MGDPILEHEAAINKQPDPSQERSFLERWQDNFGEERVHALKAFLGDVDRASSGEWIWQWTKNGGYPRVRLVLPNKGQITLLRPRSSKPEITDTLYKFTDIGPKTQAVIQSFRAELMGLPGAAPYGAHGCVSLPVETAVAASIQVIDGLNRLARGIRLAIDTPLPPHPAQ